MPHAKIVAAVGSMNRLGKMLLAALLIGGGWYAYREFCLYAVRTTAQRILYRDEHNQIKIGGVAAPNSAFLPFVGPSEWTSFVLLADKDDKRLDPSECPAAVDYRIRLAGWKYLVEMNMGELRACQAAMAVASK
jgi:hypothetical protein